MQCYLPLDTSVPLSTAVEALELLCYNVFSRAELFCKLQPRGIVLKSVHHAEVFNAVYTRKTEHGHY